MPFKIVRNDIKKNTEAIVNTANDHVSVGTGCDSAVYKAAGYDELLKYREDVELFAIHRRLLQELSKRYRRNTLLILRRLSMPYFVAVMKLRIMMPSVKCLEQKKYDT